MASSPSGNQKVFIITQCFLDVDSELSTIFRAKLSGFTREQTLEDIFRSRASATVPPLDYRRDRMLVESFVDKQRGDKYPFGLEADLDVPVSEILSEENARVVTFVVKRIKVEPVSNASGNAPSGSEEVEKKRGRKRGARKEEKVAQEIEEKAQPKIEEDMEVDAVAQPVAEASESEAQSPVPPIKVSLKKRGRRWSRGGSGGARVTATRSRPGRKPMAPPEPEPVVAAVQETKVAKKRRGRPSGSKNRKTLAAQAAAQAASNGLIGMVERRKPGRKAKGEKEQYAYLQQVAAMISREEKKEEEPEREKTPERDLPVTNDPATSKLLASAGLVLTSSVPVQPPPKRSFASDVLANRKDASENSSGSNLTKAESQASEVIPSFP